MKDFDLLIIGGGITGMTAAIYAARANLSVCIIEKEVCGGLVNWTHTVENVPSYQTIHGIDLMAKCREHTESLGVTIVEVDEVESVDFNASPKKAVSSEGDTYTGKAIIIATGRKPLPLPVETDFANVHYCAICDGTAYKNKEVIVVGGGNAGFDESLFLANLGVKKIHIVEVFPKCIAAAATQDAAKATGIISVSVNTKITAVDPLANGRALVHFEDTAENKKFTEEIDGIFVFIGQKPNTDIFKDLITMDKGYVVANLDMETNIPGVFSAGDVNVKKYRQITTAMADGTVAALNAEKYIRTLG